MLPYRPSQRSIEYWWSHQGHAPVSLFGSSRQSCSWSFFTAAQPSSVSSGLPFGVTDPVKKRGCHSTLRAFLSAAFCRCRSSISCFALCAAFHCLSRIAFVTGAQNLRDSLESCSSSGGTTLGTGLSGFRSTRSVLS